MNEKAEAAALRDRELRTLYKEEMQAAEIPPPAAPPAAPQLPPIEVWISMIREPIVKNYDGSFDCNLEIPGVGMIPFTAMPDDVENHGRAIHAHLLAQPAEGA